MNSLNITCFLLARDITCENNRQIFSLNKGFFGPRRYNLRKRENFQLSLALLCTIRILLKAVTYIGVTGHFNEIPILNTNSCVCHLTKVNEGKSISFIYRICF